MGRETGPVLTHAEWLMVLCVWREARGEPFEGKLAVAEVLRNRLADRRWPDTIEEVILQPKQFSAFNRGDPNSLYFPRDNTPSLLESLAAVQASAHSALTKGANHYHARHITPSWADPNRITAEYGGHVFYRL